MSHGPNETLLTGTTADKVKAAALAAQPGATIIRVETDSAGSPYEAHVTKADGTQVTLKIDASFKVTATEPGFGGGPVVPVVAVVPVVPAGTARTVPAPRARAPARRVGPTTGVDAGPGRRLRKPVPVRWQVPATGPVRVAHCTQYADVPMSPAPTCKGEQGLGSPDRSVNPASEPRPIRPLSTGAEGPGRTSIPVSGKRPVKRRVFRDVVRPARPRRSEPADGAGARRSPRSTGHRRTSRGTA